MNKIKELLTEPYQHNNFKIFSRELLNDVQFLPLQERTDITSGFKDAIQSYMIFGTYKDISGNNILVLSVKVKEKSSAPKTQRDFVANLLEKNFVNYNAALVAYYDDVRKNWKLSFVTVEYTIGEKGIELKYKPARRFSFLVGKDEPTKTYIQQLSPIFNSVENPSLEELIDAFSVSRLSKDFYEEYKKKYFELYDLLIGNKNFQKVANQVGYYNKDGEERFTITFCKKTLGQIMFLHFIQKKGWLGVVKQWGDGDRRYLLNSTIEFSGNYFDDFLEPLFYSALNEKRKDDEYMGCKIPFLNGGLFHPIENYDWKNTSFNIPNNYWFNTNETGLLDILSQYNFTVDESNPEEQEIAIDPEMLGKIFESLLDTKDRSSLGAFYTPREVVHYMCEEALASRVSKELSLDYDSVINYVRYGNALKEADFIKEFAEEIDNCISEFTIVDPAVGSGAFLVGMLNQIVKVRINLLNYTDKKLSIYEMKLQTIQNSLYGVDIEYDAVEIAKLRLWLSLIVDQEVVRNDAPKPLPNLNFHLKVGNSLVDTFEKIKLWNVRWRGSKKESKIDVRMNLFNAETVEVVLNRLKEAKVRFFSTSNEQEKQILSAQIEMEQIELIKSELFAQGKFDLFDKIQEMIRKKTKPFFIWELEFEEVFKVNQGFDIVIANPPYVQLQKDGGKLADELQDQNYETFARTGDIYCIFYEKGLNVLKNEGVLCYITSNKWMRAGYGEKLRGYLANNCNPIKLIDFGGNKIFESATVDVNILIASKEKNLGQTLAVTIEDGVLNNLSEYIKKNGNLSEFKNSDNWINLNKIEASIKKKIEEKGKKLLLWDELSINRGVLTGYNEAFIIDDDTRKSLIAKDVKSAELIRPILRGKDITRYKYYFAKLWMIFIPSGYTNNHKTISDAGLWFKMTFPSIYSHLIKTEEELSKIRGSKVKGLFKRDDQGDYWWELRPCKYMDDFNMRNIAWQRITKENIFCLTEPGMVILDSMAFINGAGDKTAYLLAALNSSVISFWIKKNVPEYGDTGYRLSNQFVKLMPIPYDVDQVLFDKINDLVSKIDIDTENKFLEIDDLMYKLYGLNEEEINYIRQKIYM